MYDINNYLSDSIRHVYKEIGGRNMTYYYVPIIEKSFKGSMDYIDYDFKNKIKIDATINTDITSDIDIENTKLYIKSNRNPVTIQFVLEVKLVVQVEIQKVLLDNTNSLKLKWL